MKSMLRFFVIGCHLLLSIATIAAEQPASTHGSTPESSEAPPLMLEGARAEVYKTVDGVDLYLYIFTPNDHVQSDHRPAAIFFFGGGWNSGTPRQFVPHCQYLASRGMVAVVADYRVKNRHGTTPFECVTDGKSAVRWLRTHATQLGIDPSRIAAGGGSAGGHVAAAAGLVPGLDAAGEDTNVSPKPNALLLFNPVFDNGPNGYGYERVKERFTEISPLHNIREGAPPTIVFLGTRDRLIPVATARAYEARMQDVGSRCETHFYEDQPHGFFNKGRSDDKYYRATVIALDRFLSSLGWLEGEPTLTAVEGRPGVGNRETQE